MILALVFIVYSIILYVVSFYLGVSIVRIKEKMGVHPKIISFMLPFFINVHRISTLVYDGAVCF